MAEIKVNINGIDEALDTLKKLETLCSGASMKKIPHGDVTGDKSAYRYIQYLSGYV